MRSGGCFTLNWLEVGPDGARQAGATGVNGREARESLWVRFLHVLVGLHCEPKGHDSSCTLLAANSSPLLILSLFEKEKED